MREQHWIKREHPLPYISLFNRDTYSVKRKIHTDTLFLFKCINRYYWLTSSILILLWSSAQNNNWKGIKLLQEINAWNCLFQCFCTFYPFHYKSHALYTSVYIFLNNMGVRFFKYIFHALQHPLVSLISIQFEKLTFSNLNLA